MSRQPQFVVDFADAQGCYDRLAAHLAAGVADPRHAFHWPAVVTIDGDRPAVRTVVLRAFDASERTATFHCDVRSPKVGQLRRDSRVELHLYDNDARVQVLLTATAEVHAQDGLSRAEWEAATPGSRAAYAEPLAPGTVLTADALTAAPPPIGDANDVAYANFTAVVCWVTRVELLELLPGGNRRLSLAWPGGVLTLTRLSP